MNAKEYLKQLAYIDMNINSRLVELGQVRANLQVVKSNGLKTVSVQENNVRNYDDRYLKLFELDEEINKEVDRLCKLKNEARIKIDKCQNPLHQVVLRERYINGKNWEEIADFLHFSKSHVIRIHGSALVDFNKNNPMLDKDEPK